MILLNYSAPSVFKVNYLYIKCHLSDDVVKSINIYAHFILLYRETVTFSL